ncbi:uncharacterized protein LOC120695113 [Panicum virgatum]|uniref:uncharacterized protein LOC120695113 n=1 Tax=Panicum virgatum TaxID=38727 RepID=UPI0019D5E9C5|nr:uncharacterized protein LOC120695113 [Panicum virgatum]
MDASLCALCKSLASDHCPNSCLPLSEKNGLSMFPHKALTTSSVSMNRILCASSGHSTPPEARNPAPLEESVPGLIGEIECSRDALSEVVPSIGQLNTPICERNVDEACDMSSIPEVRKQNTSSLRNQQIQERPFFIKAVRVKKGISKNKMGAIHPKAKAQGKIDASNNVQIQLKENNNSTGKEIVCALTQQVSGGTSSGDTEGVNFKKLATKEGSGLLDKELSPMINRDGSKVDERSSMLRPQNAKSSEFITDSIQSRTSSFSGRFSQISDYQVPFVKRSPVWAIFDAWDVFKKVPQQPHFRPLMEFSPALREGICIGLMTTFASTVKDISESSIADNIASFKEKITTLCHLEEHGFDVQFLRCSLVKLIQIKSDHTSYLTEKDQLKAQLLEKAACLSRIDEQLDKKEQAMARLEEELGRARWETHKIAKERA